MSALSLLLNVLWIVFGGLWMAVGWVIAAVLIAINIVGLPWTRAAFNIASYTLLPFGQKAVSRAQYYGTDDAGTGPLGVLGNIIWLVRQGENINPLQRIGAEKCTDGQCLSCALPRFYRSWHFLQRLRWLNRKR